jgi:hypothetical protein
VSIDRETFRLLRCRNRMQGGRFSRPKAQGSRPRNGRISQSAKDWAFAKRALARGESPALVAAAIAVRRPFDKYNPLYYAVLMANKAAEALPAEHVRSFDDGDEAGPAF